MKSFNVTHEFHKHSKYQGVSLGCFVAEENTREVSFVYEPIEITLLDGSSIEVGQQELYTLLSEDELDSLNDKVEETYVFNENY